MYFAIFLKKKRLLCLIFKQEQFSSMRPGRDGHNPANRTWTAHSIGSNSGSAHLASMARTCISHGPPRPYMYSGVGKESEKKNLGSPPASRAPMRIPESARLSVGGVSPDMGDTELAPRPLRPLRGCRRHLAAPRSPHRPSPPVRLRRFMHPANAALALADHNHVVNGQKVSVYLIISSFQTQ